MIKRHPANRKARKRTDVEFCDGCGAVCDARCRATATREATRNRVALVAAPVR